jgi:hypothetical protein
MQILFLRVFFGHLDRFAVDADPAKFFHTTVFARFFRIVIANTASAFAIVLRCLD